MTRDEQAWLNQAREEEGMGFHTQRVAECEAMAKGPFNPVPPTEQEREFMNVTLEMFALYREKNKRYGDSFGRTYRRYGAATAAIRLEDKINRFGTMIENGLDPLDESLDDTLMDLANYAVMTLIEMRLSRAK